MPKTTFSCSHTAITNSIYPPNPALPSETAYPPPSYFAFSCRSCAREKARLADSNVKAEYDPQIEDLKWRIEEGFRQLTRDNSDLEKAIKKMQREETRLMVEKERKLIGCWRVYRDRWE